MVKFFKTEEDKVKAIRLVAAIAQMGKILDEICFTPLRDIQVFAKKFFGSMSGSGEPITTAILLAGSFATALPYLAKIFNENETTTLQDLLKNCEKEFGITGLFDANKKLDPAKSKELKDYFNLDLQKRGLSYLEVDITQKQKRRFKNFFRKEQVCDIQYKFKSDLSDILHADKELLKYIRADNITPAEIQKFIDANQALIAEEDAIIEAKNKKLEQSKHSSDYYNIAISPKEIAAAKKQYAQKPEINLSEFLEKVKNLDDSSRELLKNMIPTKGKPEELTLAYGRQLATTRVEAFDIKNVPIQAYETANDISFQYWLAFFVFDMMYSQDDSTQWNLTAQLVAIGAAVGIFAVKLAAKIKDWFKRRKKDQQAQEELEDKDAPIKYANKSLKDKQLTSYFNTQLKTHNENLVNDPAYRISQEKLDEMADDGETLESILKRPLPEKSLLKRIKNKFFSIVKTVDEYEDIIKVETAEVTKPTKPKGPSPWTKIKARIFRIRIKLGGIKEGHEYEMFPEEGDQQQEEVISYRMTARRFLIALNVSSGMGIGFSFIEWVLTVSIAAFDIAKTGTQVVGNFLNGVGGGVIGLLSFVLGTVLGIVYYNKKVKPALDKERESLHKKYNDPFNRPKLDRLKKLEQENTAMRKYLKSKGVKLLPTMKIYSYRAYRRKTTTKNTPWTLLKKSINRFSVFVGKAGTGILLFRFLPLAILSLAGISLVAAAASVFWPITAAAIAVGLIWGGIYLYQYIQERRLDSAKHFLDRIDETLETAEAHNLELKKQFEPLAEKAEISVAEADFGLVYYEGKSAPPTSKLKSEEIPLLADGHNYENGYTKVLSQLEQPPKEQEGLRPVVEKTTEREKAPEPAKEAKEGKKSILHKIHLLLRPPVSTEEKKSRAQAQEKAQAQTQERKHFTLRHRPRPTAKI